VDVQDGLVGENDAVTNVPVTDRLRSRVGLLARPSGPPPPPLPRPGRAFDAGLALVVAIVTIQYAVDGAGDVPAPVFGMPAFVHPSQTGGWVVSALLAIAASAPLAFRRRYPLAVLCVATCASLGTPADLPRLTFYACVIAAYSAAAYSQYRLATLATLLVTALSVTAFRDSVVPVVPDQYAALLVLVPIAVAAHGLRTWKVRTDEGRTRVSTMEREQKEALRRAVQDERTRIARELHDVVTHHVSVMVIQAGAARKVMDTTPDQAREALLSVEEGGRAAMTELRHVMGLLTTNAEESDTADLAPQPGLDRLAVLVARVRDAGLSVDLTVTGQPCPLPSGVELAAYRIVQEALTNTVKHAVGAKATVAVDYCADHLRLEVTDSGGRPGAASTTGNGRGLIGLRERLAVYGGTLQTGRRLSGGYRVRATIPLEAQ
jgi:signal transduction histidine kinase